MKDIQENYGVRLEPVTPRMKDWTFSSSASKAGLSDLDEKKCLDAMLVFRDKVRARKDQPAEILLECDRCGGMAGSWTAACCSGFLAAGSFALAEAGCQCIWLSKGASAQC